MEELEILLIGQINEHVRLRRKFSFGWIVIFKRNHVLDKIIIESEALQTLPRMLPILCSGHGVIFCDLRLYQRESVTHIIHTGIFSEFIEAVLRENFCNFYLLCHCCTFL